MTRLLIAADDPNRNDVSKLIERHAQFANANSPLGKCHYFDADKLNQPQISFYSGRVDGVLAGCIALQERSESLGEIKSLHVDQRWRGHGFGEALVRHVITEARKRGYQSLSLETGSSNGFAASRRLYQALGFQDCDAFADYVANGFSVFMTGQPGSLGEHTAVTRNAATP